MGLSCRRLPKDRIQRKTGKAPVMNSHVAFRRGTKENVPKVPRRQSRSHEKRRNKGRPGKICTGPPKALTNWSLGTPSEGKTGELDGRITGSRKREEIWTDEKKKTSTEGKERIPDPSLPFPTKRKKTGKGGT